MKISLSHGQHIDFTLLFKQTSQSNPSTSVNNPAYGR
jgi:hypothetical protein